MLHHSKALAYFAKHDLPAAIESAKRAVELNSNYSDANNTLGKLLMDAKRYQEAVPFLTAAAKDSLYRDSYKAWTNLGILKYRLEEFHLASTYFDRAILDAPDRSCVAYYFRGQIKQRNYKLSEAIEDLSRATKKLCANYGEAQLALGLAYQKNRDYNSARKTFLEVQKRYPDTKWAQQAMDQLKYLP